MGGNNNEEDELFAQLGFLNDVDTTDILDVKTLSMAEILDMIEDINDELFEAHQALDPTQQWARDKHSLRNALQVERERRLKDV